MERGGRGNGVGKGVERAIKMKEGNGVEAEQEGTTEGGKKVGEGSEVGEEPEMRQRRIRESP